MQNHENEHVRGIGQREAIGLNLVLVKLATFKMTKLLLYHKIRKVGMICSVKPVLTEEVCSANGRLFNSMLHVRNTHLTKGQAYS
jgi:hypothetical protein